MTTTCHAAKATKKQVEEIQTIPPVDHIDAINCNCQETCNQRSNGPGMLRGNEQSKVDKYCGYTNEKGKCLRYVRRQRKKLVFCWYNQRGY